LARTAERCSREEVAGLVDIEARHPVAGVSLFVGREAVGSRDKGASRFGDDRGAVMSELARDAFGARPVQAAGRSNRVCAYNI